MFKKEDTEWSRFSRALSGQSKPSTEEVAAKEETPEPVPAQREVAQPASPPPPAAPARPSPTQSFTRSHASPAQQDADDVETVIGRNSSFEGTLRSEASMRIKGTTQGEIYCSKSLTIEESARVNAKITAANATVAGKLEGSMVCDGRLEILATGQVTGELTAGVLIIQEGAFFEGNFKMKDRRGDGAASEPPVVQKHASVAEGAAGE